MLEGFKQNKMLLTGQINMLADFYDVRGVQKLGKGVCFSAYFEQALGYAKSWQ